MVYWYVYTEERLYFGQFDMKEQYKKFKHEGNSISNQHNINCGVVCVRNTSRISTDLVKVYSWATAHPLLTQTPFLP